MKETRRHIQITIGHMSAFEEADVDKRRARANSNQVNVDLNREEEAWEKDRKPFRHGPNSLLCHQGGRTVVGKATNTQRRLLYVVG